MNKFILFFIIIVESYITSFDIIIRKNILGSVSNFMNLNEILNDKKCRIYKFNNSSLCFNYKTFSYLNDYKYNNIFLIKNKNTYLTKYSFKILNDEFNYLFYIKAFNKSPNRTIWNFKIKYNNLIINNKDKNDKIIYDYLFRCLNKKTNEKYNPLLINFFTN